MALATLIPGGELLVKEIVQRTDGDVLDTAAQRQFAPLRWSSRAPVVLVESVGKDC
jgi:hypothetical protein